jgi:hypothetical protein
VARDQGRAGEPDVEIGAAASAKKLRFKRKPRVEVNTHAHSEIDPQLARELDRIEGEGGSHTERENLPEEVEPGVTYRDVEVGWIAQARAKISEEEMSDGEEEDEGTGREE